MFRFRLFKSGVVDTSTGELISYGKLFSKIKTKKKAKPKSDEWGRSQAEAMLKPWPKKATSKPKKKAAKKKSSFLEKTANRYAKKAAVSVGRSAAKTLWGGKSFRWY